MKKRLSKIIFFLFTFTLFSSLIWNLPSPKISKSYFPMQQNFGFDISSKTLLTKTSPEIESWIKEKITSLTLEEKVAQMFMFRMHDTNMTVEFENFLKKNKPGGLIVMGDNITADLKNFTEEIQKTNVKLPLFIATDQEGGVVKRFKDDPNEGARINSNLNQNEFCNVYKKTSEILKSNGVNINFGIVADVGSDPKSFIFQRTFSGDPKKVTQFVSEDIRCSKGIFTTIKHYPGHGRTIDDSHKKVPVINLSYSDWEKSDGIPFIEGIKEFPDFVMVGHLNYKNIDNNPASLSKVQIENLRKIGFDGLVITDDMQMLTSAGLDSTDSLVKAFLAGNDIVLYVTNPIAPEQMIQTIVNLVKTGKISEERINASIQRILRLKVRLQFSDV